MATENAAWPSFDSLVQGAIGLKSRKEGRKERLHCQNRRTALWPRWSALDDTTEVCSHVQSEHPVFPWLCRSCPLPVLYRRHR